MAPTPTGFTAQEGRWSGPGHSYLTRPLQGYLLSSPCTWTFLEAGLSPSPQMPFPPLTGGRTSQAACRSPSQGHFSPSLGALSCVPPGLARCPVCPQDSLALTVHPSLRSASVPPAGWAGQGQGPRWVRAPMRRAHLCRGHSRGGKEPTLAAVSSIRSMEASFPSRALLPGTAAPRAAGRWGGGC